MLIKVIVGFCILCLFMACSANLNGDRDSDPGNDFLHSDLLNPRGAGYVILIGINQYNSEAIPPLKAPVKEIKSLAQIFMKNDYTVFLLQDSLATRDRILTLFHDLKDQIHASDRIIFYFAGHAKNVRNFLSDVDTSTRKYYMELIKSFQDSCTRKLKDDDLALITYQPAQSKYFQILLMQEMIQTLSTLDAYQHIVIIDACYSGNLNKIQTLPLEIYSHRLLHDGFFALTGLKKPVYDGLFGKYFIKGLNGEADTKPNGGNGNNKISIYEAAIYTDKKLATERVDPVPKVRFVAAGSGEINITLKGE